MLMKIEVSPCLKCSFMLKFVLGMTWFVLVAGCATTRAPDLTLSYGADGVYVRHLRFRITPSHTKDFEEMMKRCVAAASAAKLPDDYAWLCYREPPGRYWLLFFSDTIDGFIPPASLAGFVGHVGRAESVEAASEIMAMLAGLEYVTEWEVVFQQKTNWSSVDNMFTATHPKARIMDRTIRFGMEEAFEAALAARTAFLVEHGYPLPIEGFAMRLGAPGRAMQVVFPVDWASFHETDSFYAFVQRLDEAAQEDYAARKAVLMVTMASAEYYDGDFVRELSYSAE